jgi:hypothetical protein
MVELARERGADVLGFFYAGPLMKKGFDTGVMTYGAIRAVKPASQSPELFAEIVEQMRVVLDEDAAWSAKVTPATTLDGDLELESIELTAVSRVLQARHGAAVDLAAHVAELGVEEIIALTVGDVAAYVSARSAGA